MKGLAALTVELGFEKKFRALHTYAGWDSNHTLVGHSVVLVVL